MKRLIFAACVAMLCGCANYTTPGAGVSLASISEKDGGIAEAFKREPAAVFPARLAFVRVAANGYRSATADSVGHGAFSVVTVRDIEQEEDFQRLGRMPQVVAAAPLSRLLLPGNLGDTKDLRTAAAQLKADALLIYTIDTRFRTDTTELGPLQTVTLGFLSTKKSYVTATCAFLVLDVRSGFVYGAGETSVTETQRSNIWSTEHAVEEARARAESGAFGKGLTEINGLWTNILFEHAGRAKAA